MDLGEPEQVQEEARGEPRRVQVDDRRNMKLFDPVVGAGWLRQVAAGNYRFSGAGLTLGVCPNTTPRGLLLNTSVADELRTHPGAPVFAGSWSRGIAGNPLRSKFNTRCLS